jgi:hypothetical protein
MALDRDLAVENLRRASRFLDQAPSPDAKDEFAAELYELCLVLFEEPAVADTVAELLASRHLAGSDLKAWWKKRSERAARVASEAVTRLSDAITRCQMDVQRYQPARGPAFGQKISEFLAQPRSRHATRATTREALKLGATVENVIAEGPEFMGELSAALLGAEPLIQEMNGLGWNQQEVLSLWQVMQLAVQETSVAMGELDFLRRTYQQINHVELVADLRKFFKTIRGAQTPAAEAEAMPNALDLTQSLTTRRRAIQRLTNDVGSRLEMRGSRRHVIARMQSFFEHFYRDELTAFLKGELAKPAGAQLIEAVLQRELDLFAFQQGTFPITHSEAMGGLVDTFIYERSAWFKEARDSGQPPLTMELRHVIAADGNVTATDVLTAVEEALFQADLLKKHIAVRHSWAGPEVYAVVFYNGPTRYYDGRSNVALVFIGRSTSGDTTVDLTAAAGQARRPKPKVKV